MRRKEKLGGGERENESERVGEIESERRSSSSRILKRKKNCSNNKILFVCLERKREREKEREKERESACVCKRGNVEYEMRRREIY